MLAADSEAPIQGCPTLEYSFQCSQIIVGDSAYDDTEIAIRFYEDGDSIGELRLTMTHVASGYWYLWANSNSKPYPSSKLEFDSDNPA